MSSFLKIWDARRWLAVWFSSNLIHGLLASLEPDVYRWEHVQCTPLFVGMLIIIILFTIIVLLVRSFAYSVMLGVMISLGLPG